MFCLKTFKINFYITNTYYNSTGQLGFIPVSDNGEGLHKWRLENTRKCDIGLHFWRLSRNTKQSRSPKMGIVSKSTIMCIPNRCDEFVSYVSCVV